MKIKRFFAKDMRAALSQVKEELGADAVIMSNKKVTGGVEIVAAVDADTEPMPDKPAPKAQQQSAQAYSQAHRQLADDQVQLRQRQQAGSRQNGSTKRPPRFSAMLDEYREQSQTAEPETEADSLSALLQRQQKQSTRSPSPSGADERPTALGRGYEPRRQLKSSSRSGWQTAANKSSGPQASPSTSKPKLDPSRFEGRQSQASHQEIDAMRQEMASIRSLLEHQLSGLMWQEVERREPLRAMLIKRLERMGLSSELADQLACYIPEETPPNEAWQALLDLVADQVITVDENMLETGGVIALLGPTGVGKTTTIAKLAARAAMEFGPEDIALVTTDTFRIGAHEQLATYGRILGCPVKVAKDADELADILYQLRHRRLILLDTAGMGQRDLRLSEQLDTLMQNSGSHIRSLLVLPATSQRRVLQETIEHFRRIPLSGCVLTKLDESLSLGELLCVTIENALPVAYLADGQRVPEDIRQATGQFLVGKASEMLESGADQHNHFWNSDVPESNGADFYD
ncbi:flagellar biosynthesis protein FlhF [Salinivibrio sharmensis]|uniref:Flagellar biosynthesis protein FlhF n=1 Tax=Salinivibrio sharmensis TaxID=390883 RepID=A0ABX3KKC5_9GAMM|nr:flagellar biosynthesis protein FlhF [Salinivibrio sharmensis]OOE89756.1 flagellar biosynthesis protein FlhF [Salinivibrio sharmensis]